MKKVLPGQKAAMPSGWVLGAVFAAALASLYLEVALIKLVTLKYYSIFAYAILGVAPARIVYVSCNPATQARDLQMLGENYKVLEIQPFDMFPQTYHVENIVLLVRKQPMH